MNYKIKTEQLIITLIIITIITKLFLISDGMFAFPDEARYDASVYAFYDLINLNVKGFLNKIFSTDARPGDVLLRIIPVAFQKINTLLFNINIYDPINSYPIFLFNYVVHLLILLIHYRLSKILFQEKVIALLSLLIFSSLISSYIYLRHCLPYDASLLLLYFVMYQFIKMHNCNKVTSGYLLSWGSLMAIAYLIYPGYSLFFAAFSMLLLIMLYIDYGLTKSLKQFLVFVAAICLVIFCAEVMSRIGNSSYIWSAMNLSSTITQGNFEESFIFIIKYLLQVEGLSGVILILGVGGYLIFLIYQPDKDNIKSITSVAFYCFSAVVLLYAVLGFFFQKVVFYGRLIHQFLPLICIFAVFPLNKIYLLNKHKNHNYAIGAIAVCVFISFSINMHDYLKLAYPRDTHASFVKNGTKYKEQIEFSSAHGHRFNYPRVIKESNNDPDIILVNCCYYYPFLNVEKKPVEILDEYEIIFSKPHFLNFKAYQFEGFRIKARSNIDHYQMNIKVYKKSQLSMSIEIAPLMAAKIENTYH